MREPKRKTHQAGKKTKTIPILVCFFVLLMVVIGTVFLVKNKEILKAATGREEVISALPDIVKPIDKKRPPEEEPIRNELKNATKKDLGVDVTTVPNRFLTETPPSDAEESYYIEGEYAFFPQWRDGQTRAIICHNGVIKEYTNSTDPKNEIFTKEDIDSGKENYVVFTRMGLYKGQPVSIKMTPVEVPNEVMIGVSNESVYNSGLVSGKPEDVNGNAAMSISKTGLPRGKDEYCAQYVKMNYSFYNSSTEDIPAKNYGSPISVKGFLTYVDFDHEESIGVNQNAKMQRAYFVKSDKDDPDYLTEPTDLQDPNYKEKYYEYLTQTNNYMSNHYSQLLYKKADDYLFINRGWRSNTDADRKGSWFQYTYGETSSFDMLINASSIEHKISYATWIDRENQAPSAQYVKIFESQLDTSAYDANKKMSEFYLSNKELFLDRPGLYKEEWRKWANQKGSEERGSTVGFAPETLLPILFPNPVKKADQKTSDEEIKWEISHDVPARKIQNGEPQFVFTDEFDECLTIDNDIRITDGWGKDVTKEKINGQPWWNIKQENNKVTIEASKEVLQASDSKFYGNTYVIVIKTKLNRDANYMEHGHFEEETSQLVFKNQSILTMKHLDMTDRVIKSKPSYDEKEGPTEGRIDVAGKIKIIKIAEDTKKPLPGAEFELRDKDNKTKAPWKGTTDSKGELILPTDGTLITGGVYTLKETKAPDGYDPVPDEKITISLGTKLIELTDLKAKEIGNFEKPEKKVLNQSGKSIDGELVSHGDILTYQIKVKDDGIKPDTVIKKVVVTDILDEKLELVANSTRLIPLLGGTGEALLDSDVWSVSDKTMKLVTKGRELKSAEGFIIEWKVKVKGNASGTIENEGKITGEGRRPGQNTLEEISDQTNKVVNYLSIPVNLRQIIVNSHSSLVVPKNEKESEKEKYGYFQLNNLDGDGKKIVGVNQMVHSEENIQSIVYTSIKLMPKDGNMTYTVVPVLPEMYRLIGYAHTTGKNQSMVDVKSLAAEEYPKILLDGNKTHYITIVLEPALAKTATPPFYNWDYRLNEFENAITIK